MTTKTKININNNIKPTKKNGAKIITKPKQENPSHSGFHHKKIAAKKTPIRSENKPR
jgi:hypothetical protein